MLELKLVVSELFLIVWVMFCYCQQGMGKH